ncbi:hypothetical protein SAMN05444149_109118 [Pseudosulfitobacter pseudonitzschiae]|nr:hypothetical protein SAMN05444149_109118 [Pseudosulfitobacter pseudonitzschiae]
MPLDILNVTFKITSYDVCVFSRGSEIARYERSLWCQTGLGNGTVRETHEQNQSPCTSGNTRR